MKRKFPTLLSPQKKRFRYLPRHWLAFQHWKHVTHVEKFTFLRYQQQMVLRIQAWFRGSKLRKQLPFLLLKTRILFQPDLIQTQILQGLDPKSLLSFHLSFKDQSPPLSLILPFYQQLWVKIRSKMTNTTHKSISPKIMLSMYTEATTQTEHQFLMDVTDFDDYLSLGLEDNAPYLTPYNMVYASFEMRIQHRCVTETDRKWIRDDWFDKWTGLKEERPPISQEQHDRFLKVIGVSYFPLRQFKNWSRNQVIPKDLDDLCNPTTGLNLLQSAILNKKVNYAHHLIFQCAMDPNKPYTKKAPYKDELKVPPLHYSIAMGDLKMIKFLVYKAGVDVNQPIGGRFRELPRGATPLDTTELPWMVARTSKRKEIISILIEAGAKYSEMRGLRYF